MAAPAYLLSCVFLTFSFIDFTTSADIVYVVSENARKGFVVGKISDQGQLSRKYNSTIIERLHYSLMSRGSLPTDYFSIDNKTSELRIARPVDRDNLCDLLMMCCDSAGKCSVKLSVVVQPSYGPFFAEMIQAKVEILDENDNQPTFQSRTIRGHISEVASIGSTVSLSSDGNPLIATDKDGANNGIEGYSIISPTGTFGLKIQEEYEVITDVSIVSKAVLDREKVPSYTVVVIAHDKGSPSRSGSVTVQIDVDDFNDHAPKFLNDSYSVWLSETAPLDTFVARVEALDDDSGSNGAITYSITNLPSDMVTRLFTINPNTGDIRTKARLDFEEKSLYRIHVEAKDDGVFVKRKSRTSVTVKLRDINDHGPNIRIGYVSSSDRAVVMESAPHDTLVVFLLVTDPDQDEVDCMINNPRFKLRRSNQNKNEFRLLTAHPLNREQSAKYEVNVECLDKGTPQMRTAESFYVHVLDANDNAPLFTESVYRTSLMENNELDIFVLEVQAHDVDTGENARIIYSLNEEGVDLFTINSATGRIYTKHVFDREQGDRIKFGVIARDNGTVPLHAEASVVISITDQNDNAPTFHNGNKFEISEAAGPGVMLGLMSASDPDIGRNAEIVFSFRMDRDSRSFAINNGVITTAVHLDREAQSQYSLVVVARDLGLNIVHSSSTTVTVVVTDVNDNAPVIHFPNTYNNTIYISYQAQVGQTIVHVNATDADEGRHALLEYQITYGNEEGIFSLNSQTGAVLIAKAMQQSDALVYKMGVRVRDKAEPYHTSNEIINIVVDGTGKAIRLDGTYVDSITDEKNLIIVICLAAVCALLAVVLVVAIICVRRTHRNQELYDIQTESRNANNTSPLPTKDCKYQPPIRRDINFPTEVDDSYHHVNGHQSPVYSSLRSQNWKSSVYPKTMAIGTKV